MDLNNMNNFKYKQAMKPLSQMIKNNILNIINKQQKFSAFNINETLNVFFKIMRELFTKVVITLIQTY